MWRLPETARDRCATHSRAGCRRTLVYAPPRRVAINAVESSYDRSRGAWWPLGVSGATRPSARLEINRAGHWVVPRPGIGYDCLSDVPFLCCVSQVTWRGTCRTWGRCPVSGGNNCPCKLDGGLYNPFFREFAPGPGDRAAELAAGVAQLAEHNVANVVVVGPNPITRSF
jgi:hypothetical protein